MKTTVPIATLVNTTESPCPGTHGAACMEFLEGFTSHGYTIRQAHNLSDCTDSRILLLSNHNIDWDFLHRLNMLCPDALFILWFFHPHIMHLPFKYWILTGEHYYEPPTLQTHLPAHQIASSIPNFVPLQLRVNEAPERIGTYVRPANPKYLGCFMGSPYKAAWVQDIPNIYYHNINERGLLTSDQRRAVYLDSVFGFGFHSNENVANNHVTQRVFEALAYGCVVLSDNPAAVKMTDGIVEYVGSPADVKQKIEWFLARPDKIAEKQAAGYVWSMERGTNRYAASLFLLRALELWGWGL